MIDVQRRIGRAEDDHKDDDADAARLAQPPARHRPALGEHDEQADHDHRTARVAQLGDERHGRRTDAIIGVASARDYVGEQRDAF